MCICVYAPAGKKIPREYLENSWEVNSDGAGLMFVRDKKLYVYKELWDKEAFFEYYEHMYEVFGEASPFVLHFRIITHGKIDLLNCHPHKVNENLAFVHNGIISGVGATMNGEKSDSVLFGEKYLRGLPEGALDNESIRLLIADKCGSSKLVFLDNIGNVYMINDNLGEWNEGIWYSNSSYKSSAPFYSGSSCGAHGSSWRTSWKNEKHKGVSACDCEDKDWEDYWEKKKEGDKKNKSLNTKVADISESEEVEELDICPLCGKEFLINEAEEEFGLCWKCLKIQWLEEEMENCLEKGEEYATAY